MAGELILIVEDNEKNLKLARDILRFHGFRVVEAMTAGEGLAAAREHQPDLVLMDVQLPDMDGVSALAELRRDENTAAIPAIAITAFAMKGDRERLLAAGFNGYLSKPIDVWTFPDSIRDFCEQTRPKA